MKALFRLVVICGVLGVAAGLFLTRPSPLDPQFSADHTANIQNGELIFTAAGCASCHAAPGSDDNRILAGGYAFDSDFGTFYAPNISPSEVGIGGWSLPEFARAVTKGVSPDGKHYYPAFPYGSYQHMAAHDVADLFAFMQTLPKSDVASRSHDVGFPFNIRRSLGGWKLLFTKDSFVVQGDLEPPLDRGRYLVEALAHCGECHTPRNSLGGWDRSAWLTGAPNPSGKGKIPNITPSGLDWSEDDLVYYFETGFTPDFDSAGGSMVSVVENLAKLPADDRAAIAAYLKSLP